MDWQQCLAGCASRSQAGQSELFAHCRGYTKLGGDINVQSLTALDADRRTVARFQYHERSTRQEFQTDSFAAATTRTGRIEHQIVRR